MTFVYSTVRCDNESEMLYAVRCIGQHDCAVAFLSR
jgi:hypothetical protein